MKKIIKIAALVLSLLCIGTSLASCGESNQEMADNIRTNINIPIFQPIQPEKETAKKSKALADLNYLTQTVIA